MERGKDNFINSYDYLKNQIFKYNFLNEEHLHILKLKLWALDGMISSSENIKDEDVNNPLNHYDSLLNEIYFLDLYIRTKDRKLKDNEMSFNELVSVRKEGQREFTRQINPETNKRFNIYDQPYSQRPTLLNTSQFQELYLLYKEKENKSELLNVNEVITKVSDKNINKEIYLQELAISRAEDPSVTESRLKSLGSEEAFKEDVNLVKEMNEAHIELENIIKSIKPSAPSSPPTEIEDTSNTTSNNSSGDTKKPNPISWSNSKIVIVNMPTRREQVGHSSHHPSHKGMIVEQNKQGGYRYFYKDGSDLISLVSIPSDVPAINGDLKNEVEWNFNNWFYAFYYEESNSDSGQSSKNFISLNVSYNNLSENMKKRHDELNLRWTNLNRLREDQIQNTGTRIKLESMFNAEIPDIRPDYIDHLNDKKTEKMVAINILKERCLFNEFI